MKLLLIFLAIGWVVPIEEISLTTLKISKEISLKVPDSFVPVADNEINQKYISQKKPLAFYTSPDRKSDLVVNVIPTQWQENDLVLMKNFYRTNLYNLYDSVHILKEEIVEINKRQFIVFEFLSTVNPEPNNPLPSTAVSNYSYLQYCIINGKLVLISFTTPVSQRSRWQNVVVEMMNSIKIKKTL